MVNQVSVDEILYRYEGMQEAIRQLSEPVRSICFEAEGELIDTLDVENCDLLTEIQADELEHASYDSAALDVKERHADLACLFLSFMCCSAFISTHLKLDGKQEIAEFTEKQCYRLLTSVPVPDRAIRLRMVILLAKFEQALAPHARSSNSMIRSIGLVPLIKQWFVGILAGALSSLLPGLFSGQMQTAILYGTIAAAIALPALGRLFYAPGDDKGSMLAYVPYAGAISTIVASVATGLLFMGGFGYTLLFSLCLGIGHALSLACMGLSSVLFGYFKPRE